MYLHILTKCVEFNKSKFPMYEKQSKVNIHKRTARPRSWLYVIASLEYFCQNVFSFLNKRPFWACYSYVYDDLGDVCKPSPAPVYPVALITETMRCLIDIARDSVTETAGSEPYYICICITSYSNDRIYATNAQAR